MLNLAFGDLYALKLNEGVNRNTAIHINPLKITLAANSLAMTPPHRDFRERDATY